MSDLFAEQGQKAEGLKPLAERMRPKTVGEVIGQGQILDKTAPLGAMLTSRKLGSLVFWGPPGVGKTTLARLLADYTNLHFEQISATFSGVADLKKCFDSAKLRAAKGRGTLLFVDEIHRFNKTQQDGFLPHMEDGTILLVGATTENPSFELNAALLSRAQVMVLTRLSEAELAQLLERAEQELCQKLALTSSARQTLVSMADGDGRALLNLIEQVAGWETTSDLEPQDLMVRLTRRAAIYDKSGDGHYNLVSALHKSVRGSDPDASLYWLSRMLEGGEDPRYLARRILRMAIEDIGLADPQAQTYCLQAWETYERLGSPEGELVLAQAVIYLALAPKSNAGYAAYKAARSVAKISCSTPPPKHILNAPTDVMKDLGYGQGYNYDHEAEDGFSGQNYFPDVLGKQSFYQPIERGFERDLDKRLQYFNNLRAKRRAEI